MTTLPLIRLETPIHVKFIKENSFGIGTNHLDLFQIIYNGTISRIGLQTSPLCKLDGDFDFVGEGIFTDYKHLNCSVQDWGAYSSSGSAYSAPSLQSF